MQKREGRREMANKDDRMPRRGVEEDEQEKGVIRKTIGDEDRGMGEHGNIWVGKSR